MVKTLAILIFGLAIIGCSHEKPKEEIAARSEEKPLLVAPGSGLVAVIKFNRNEAHVVPAAKAKLEKFVRQAATHAPAIIKVFSWSDDEYPEDEDSKLPKDAVALADRRNNEIRILTQERR